MFTNRVIVGTTKCVLFIEVSILESFHPIHVCTCTHIPSHIHGTQRGITKDTRLPIIKFWQVVI